ncbi:PaaX family transcriptional regulator [Nonomuraea sp. NPDC003201]
MPRRTTLGPGEAASRPSGAQTDGLSPAAEGRGGRSGSAAKSLIDVLSEYVAPRSAGVWHETLVLALGVLGHSPAAVRQAVSRSAREGALTTTRHGNRAYVELTQDMRETLSLGTRHFAAEEAPSGEWDGTWDVFIVRSRGKDQRDRYRFRTLMLLNGLGYLGNGVWISPDCRFKDVIMRALSDEPGVIMTVMTSQIEYPDVRAVAEQAWDLDAVADRYERLLVDFGDRIADGPEECFRAWTGLTQAWRECVLTEPGLPSDVLRPDWPRERARNLVARCRSAWRPAAHAFFQSLAGTGAGPSV